MEKFFIYLVDFNLGLLPAARNALKGIDPYIADPGFFMPPWILYPVFPLTLIPESLASLIWLGLIVGLALMSLHYAALHFHMPPDRRKLMLILGLLLTPFSLQTFFSGQYTPFVMLGIVGSFVWNRPALTLLLLSLKPQLGALSAVILVLKLAKEQQWFRLLGILAAITVIIGISFLIVPHSFSHFWKGVLAGRSMSLEREWTITIPTALKLLGIGGRYIPALYLLIASIIITGLFLRRDLPMIVICSLVLAPYAREYDYVLLLIPALYLIHQRYALIPSILLLFFPLHRFFVGDRSWSWISIIIPLIFFLILISETRKQLKGLRAGP